MNNSKSLYFMPFLIFSLIFAFACSDELSFLAKMEENVDYNSNLQSDSPRLLPNCNDLAQSRELIGMDAKILTLDGSLGRIDCYNPPPRPAAPSDIRIEESTETTITLAWNDNSGNESGFKLERSSDGENFLEIAALAIDTTSYLGSLPAGSFAYRVKAYNSAGDSVYSSTGLECLANCGPPPMPPDAPSNLSATTVASEIIEINWTDNSSNETGFLVERKTDDGDFSQILELGENIIWYQDTTVQYGHTYAYRVRAFNFVGNSAFSNEDSSCGGIGGECPCSPCGPPMPPSSPSNLQAAIAGAGAVELFWQDNSDDETGFSIELAYENSGWVYVPLADVAENVTSVVVINIEQDQPYYFRVRSFNDVGSSYGHTETCGDLGFGCNSPPEIPPAQPSGLYGLDLTDRILLKWNDNSFNEWGFVIERAISGIGAFEIIGAVEANATSFFDETIIVGESYEYLVYAFNEFGTSGFSATGGGGLECIVNCGAPPPPPGGGGPECDGPECGSP